MTKKNIFPFRIESQNKDGEVIWLFGLSGAGKTTLARKVRTELLRREKTVYLLDADNMRNGLNSDLGYTNEDRDENLRRSAEVAKLLSETVDYVICTFITPIEKSRVMISKIIGRKRLTCIYISTPLEVCESRDPKGLYKLARSGEIKSFTGIDSIFEKPRNINKIIEIDTSKKSEEQCTLDIMKIIS